MLSRAALSASTVATQRQHIPGVAETNRTTVINGPSQPDMLDEVWKASVKLGRS